MSRILKKALLVFLLGWVPLQASAYSLIDVLCGRDSSTIHGHAAVHAPHGPAGERAGDDDQGNGGNGASSPVPLHHCYHQPTSTTPPSVRVSSAPATPDVEPTALFHLFSFFPEQPKRPPLAA